MALLKSQDAEALMRDAVVVDLSDPQSQADAIRRRATVQAAQILQNARQEADKIRAEAAAAGREAGHAEALEQFGQSLDQLQDAWVRAAQQWDADRARMVEEAQRSLIAVRSEEQ